MALLDPLIELTQFQGIHHPEYLWLLIPLAIVFLLLLKKDFVKAKEDQKTRKRRKTLQWIVLFLRLIIFALLLIAVATPFVMQEKFFEGDPVIHVVVDKTRSMDVFEDRSEQLIESLKQHIEVEVTTIDSADQSSVGDAILGQLRPFESVLLLSDGNANSGSELGDVAIYASSLNATINAIDLSVDENDASVSVIGPRKVLEGIANDYFIHISSVGSTGSRPVTVTVDGDIVFDETTDAEIIPINRAFAAGDHVITAKIDSADYFIENNVYYKSIKSVARPKILVYSPDEGSPLTTLLKQQFDVTTMTTLPNDPALRDTLDPYYAVIVNNLDADTMTPKLDSLTNYIADGNGLLNIGGRNSYNYGAYKFSEYESILPVQVAKPGKQEGDIAVVVVIDISGSTSAAFGDGKAVDVEKALALSVLDDLDAQHRLGVVAFNSQAHLVSPLSFKYEKIDMVDRVSRLKDGGGTQVHAGLLKAIDMLGEVSGSKNIILISDGKTQAESSAIEAAKLASNQGIRTYTIGVGPKTDDEFMQLVADLTTGIYFKASEASNLRILFGDLESERNKDLLDVIILNSNHFITSNLQEIRGKVAGFNQIVPKTTANMLVTTSAGDPLLTIWRFGLGRVGAYTTDDGTMWAGDMLSAQNSKLLLRTVNYVVGDPDRKDKNSVEAFDTRVGEATEILVRSETPPIADQYTFYKLDDETYSATIVADTLGLNAVLGTQFAVNYPSELQFLGINPDLNRVVFGTGGQVFADDEIEQIVDNTKSRAQRTINTKTPVRMPFIIGAIIIFLTELLIRRLLRKE
jgi:uncharacterized membrane protein